VNTPQFDWARSRMAGRALPLPPVFQPEAVAPEIVRAAREAPRELWIGHSTLKAIAGAMFMPETGDRVLSRDGYAGEHAAGPPGAVHVDNLFAPPPGDPGTRGPFNRDALDTAAGFEPATLQNGGLFLALTSLAGAFAAGTFVGRLTDGHAAGADGAAHTAPQARVGREVATRFMPLALMRAKRRMVRRAW
jgi:hypothetical protein